LLRRKGPLSVTAPATVRWTDATGRHIPALPAQPSPSCTTLMRFHDGIRQGAALSPNLKDAYRRLRWLRAARESLQRGISISINHD